MQHKLGELAQTFRIASFPKAPIGRSTLTSALLTSEQSQESSIDGGLVLYPILDYGERI